MAEQKSILVTFAVKEEARLFLPFSKTTSHVRVLLTGMGQRNAERVVRAALKAERPDLVLSAGFAGGLRPGLPTGTVVVAEDDTGVLAAALMAAGAQRGTFHCADSVASTVGEKQALWEKTRADAVEMESQVICGICREEKIPGTTVRVILDTAEEDLPLDFNRLMTADLRLDPVKLALNLAKSPGKIPGLLRLRRQTEEASRKLADVLRHAIRNLA